jgi:hypothetical protein
MLLMMELALFAIILIHPDVDLPEFTFHTGNAPVTAKHRFSIAPVMVANVTAAATLLSPPVYERVSEAPEAETSQTLHVRLSMLCSLIC